MSINGLKTGFNTCAYDFYRGSFSLGKDAPDVSLSGADSELYILPGFCDVHVHFREPGFSYKETFETGTAAAARGGFTDVCPMPNLKPVPDSLPHLSEELECMKKGIYANVRPYGALTVGECGAEIADLEGMSKYVVGFSDDGKGVQSPSVMESAMRRVKALGKIIAAHCEDNSLLRGGCIHDGEFASAHGYAGICSESEWGPIARDIELAVKTGCPYHVCHLSCRESVELIRQAKKSGVDITCETGPHYLIFSDKDLKEEGRFKMNPPIRSEKDREALIEGICDGTVDMIATDHAPHSAEEKAKGLKDSAFGVVGLETSFPAMYTHFVKTGIITLEKLVKLMAVNPRKRFGINPDCGYSVWDLDGEFTVNPDKFLTKGRATPFEGMKLKGINLLTVNNNKITYKAGE